MAGSLPARNCALFACILFNARPPKTPVGGAPDLVGIYQGIVNRMKLSTRVHFEGMQQDLRPYLWAGDAFIFPSAYETFSLVSFEAAAAGLPLIVSHIYGVEDIIRPGENGFLVDRNSDSLTAVLQKLLLIPDTKRMRLGTEAQRSVQGYDASNFVVRWNEFYGSVLVN